PGLIITLARVAGWLGGALAIVSGRSLPQIDSLLAPLQLPCAAEHGAIMRLPHGEIVPADADCAVSADWRERLCAGVAAWPGVILEEKRYSVVIHFRSTPSCENDVRRLVQNVVAADPENFEILPARMALEIRHRDIAKGAAVSRFMEEPPFRG